MTDDDATGITPDEAHLASLFDEWVVEFNDLVSRARDFAVAAELTDSPEACAIAGGLWHKVSLSAESVAAVMLARFE